MSEPNPGLFFEVFLEIGIISQLSRAMLEEEMPDGLIQPHFGVLSHLSRVADGRTPLELARAFQVPKTSMTHTLKGLERHGLIEILPNPQDGRSKLVWLTDEGRQLRLSVIEALGPSMAKMAAKFDMHLLQEMLPKLTELRIFLDENRDIGKAANNQNDVRVRVLPR